ncbi:MAG: SPASM domain-containing protein [Lachnospiraceae bacterium]|nr:SPASM domain-containing protein [Lachnospiraceae bacterium]
MSVRYHNFGGIIGWNLQKLFPSLSANSYLKLQFISRRKLQKEYIDFFMSSEEPPYPLVVNLETINRCNSNCAFCTANKYAEKRPYCRMDDGLFYRIIDQLADWGYKGHLTLYGNNEPWLDTRIVEFHKYCREKLPDCFIFMSTNGLLLDIDKVKSVLPYVDQLIINNYCEDMKLHENVKEIYEYARSHKKEFKDVELLIQMRYAKAVLTNRAGSAPNKVNTQKVINETCLMPYTDIFIFPDGRMGICCCDNYEATTLADLNKVNIKDAWNSLEYQKIRKAITNSRAEYPFCKYCDFIDAGLRMDAVDDTLRHRDAHHGARQNLFRKARIKK